MIMRKNVNNDVSKDLPIMGLHFQESYCNGVAHFRDQNPH